MLNVSKSLSNQVTFPELFEIRFNIRRHILDFPDPDSPTIPSVSPSKRLKEIPSTALTISFLEKKPFVEE